MKVERDGIDSRLNQCDSAAQQHTSGHEVNHAESDGEMHYCEGKSFGHDAPEALMGMFPFKAFWVRHCQA
jgi:hypothetical protein